MMKLSYIYNSASSIRARVRVLLSLGSRTCCSQAMMNRCLGLPQSLVAMGLSQVSRARIAVLKRYLGPPQEGIRHDRALTGVVEVQLLDVRALHTKTAV